MPVYSKLVIREIEAANTLFATLALGVGQALAFARSALTLEIVRERLTEVHERLLSSTLGHLKHPRKLVPFDGVEGILEVANLDAGLPVRAGPVVHESGRSAR